MKVLWSLAPTLAWEPEDPVGAAHIEIVFSPHLAEVGNAIGKAHGDVLDDAVRYAIRCLIKYGKCKFQQSTEVIWRDMP